jgi:hypothetical protein
MVIDHINTLEGLYFEKLDFFNKYGYMRNKVEAPFQYKFGGDEGLRNIYSFFIDGLIPSTEYAFLFSISGKNYTRCANDQFGF